jgi:hypothetical protein
MGILMVNWEIKNFLHLNKSKKAPGNKSGGFFYNLYGFYYSSVATTASLVSILLDPGASITNGRAI